MTQYLVPIPIKFYLNVNVIITKSFSSDFLSSSLLLVQGLLHIKPRFLNANASMDTEMLISYPRHERNHTYLFQGRPKIGYNTEIWVGQCNQMNLFKLRKNLRQVCKMWKGLWGGWTHLENIGWGNSSLIIWAAVYISSSRTE